MISSKEQEAMAKATFYAIAERNKIEASNEAQRLKFEATKSILDFNESFNFRMAQEYANEVTKGSSYEILKGKVDVNQKLSTIALSEGITGGASKGRIVQTAGLQASQALGEIVQKNEATIGKLNQQVLADNKNLADQKMNAYNTMLSNVVQGPLAALQIQAASQQGYMLGLELGKTKEQLNIY